MSSRRLKQSVVYFVWAVCVLCGSYAFATEAKRGVLQLAQEKIPVEIADTLPLRQKGLMFRESLPQDSGMLFVFDKEEPASFWMRNTLIPLDLAFFTADRCLLELHHLVPLSITLTHSSKPVLYALEMNQGWFAQKKIPPGACFTLLKD